MSAFRPEQLQAEDCHFGPGFSLGEGSHIGGIGGAARSVRIGAQVSIGPGVHIAAPEVEIGNYVTIHRNTTIYGYSPVSIGDCTWIGQNVVLNCTAKLTIGRGGIISAYSSIWTHFAGGDVLQGCRYDEAAAVSIGEDVWIGVGATVSPVMVADRVLVLAGAVLTKAAPSNTVWGGNPAVDLTEKLGPPFVNVPVEDKYRLLCELLRLHQCGKDLKQLRLPAAASCPPTPGPSYTSGGITIMLEGDSEKCRGTLFDVRDRTYSNNGRPEEVAFMRALLYRVKFFPRKH